MSAPTRSDGYEEERLAGLDRASSQVLAQAGEAIAAGDLVQVGKDGRLERLNSTREDHYSGLLDHARCQEALAAAKDWGEQCLTEGIAATTKAQALTHALEDISKKAVRAQNHGSMADALLAINETAQKALQRPVEGTRVRCLMPHRGEQGTVVGWQSELDLPLIEWDELRGEVPEACELGEFEILP